MTSTHLYANQGQGESATSQPSKSSSIQGRVLDENRQPVIGATVIYNGRTPVGAITNNNGEFKLNAPLGSKISVSFIGYNTQDIVTNAATKSLVITLVPSTNELDEIVVVGYGEVKKANLTGAVVSLGSKNMESTTSVDVVNSLTGRTPGVRVAQFSSEPGVFDTDIDIRGLGAPLVIIDGVERSKDEFSRMTSNEIESISVIKDGSAAIYGVKAANGVLLVTTKAGVNSRPIVSYSGRLGIQTITQFMDAASAYDYGMMFNELTINNSIKGRSYLKNVQAIHDKLEYQPDFFAGVRDGSIPNYNMMDALFNDFALQQSHSVSLRGGTAKSKYFFSASYFGEQGLFSSNDLNSDKYNFRLKVDTEVAKGLTLSVNLGYINTLREGLYATNFAIFKGAITHSPTYEIYANNNPDYLATDRLGSPNPLAMINRDMSGFSDDDDKFLQTNTELRWAVPYVKGLSAGVRYSYDYIFRFNRRYKKPYNLYQYDSNKDEYLASSFQSLAALSERISQETRDNVKLDVAYNYKTKVHNLSTALIYEQRSTRFRSTNASTDIALDGITELAPGIVKSNKVGSSFAETANQSIIGRVNYDYKGRYLFNTSFRYDGSSKFPSNSRWGFFPSASFAWRISEEQFIKKNLKMVDNLKLRLSWGKLGDDRAADFQFLTGFNYPSDNGWQFGDEWVTGVGLRDVANPYITWYTSQTLNAGIDMSLWRSKLTLSVDVFQRTRDGLLGQQYKTLPGYFGAALPFVNLNGDRTRGYEIEIGHKNTIRKWSYGTSLNISYTRTARRHFAESPARDQSSFYTNTLSNRYNDIVWGYKTDGVFKSFEEIAAGPYIDNLNKGVLPGDPKYIDQNGDGIIDAKDKVALGSGGLNKPLYYFAIDTYIRYKSFDFKMLWQGGLKNLVKYQDGPLYQPFAFGAANFPKSLTSRWFCHDLTDPYNSASWTPGKYPAPGTSGPWLQSDLMYFEANYLRLKNVEFGYTIPQRLSKKIAISRARVYVNAFNVLTFTNGYSFLDPEINAGRNYSYPVTLNVNFGIDVTF